MPDSCTLLESAYPLRKLTREFPLAGNENPFSLNKMALPGPVSRQAITLAQLPPDRKILSEARLLLEGGKLSAEKLSNTLFLDPVAVIEVLRMANLARSSAGLSPTYSLRTAITYLGFQSLAAVFDSFQNRGAIASKEVEEEFESLRKCSRDVAGIAKIIALTIEREFIELSQVAGLLSQLGHFLACSSLGQDYVKLARKTKKTVLSRELMSEFGVDTYALQLDNLRTYGLPEEVLNCLDHGRTNRTLIQSRLCFINQSAVELMEAHESQLWKEYAPGTRLQSQSALRLLKLGDSAYVRVIETLDAFFQGITPDVKAARATASFEIGDSSLPQSGGERAVIVAKPGRALDRDLGSERTQQKSPWFSAGFIPNEASPSPDHPKRQSVRALGSRSMVALHLVRKLCLECSSTQDLLTRMLSVLVTHGCFTRAAVVRVEDGRLTRLHMAFGSWPTGRAEIEQCLRYPLSVLQASAKNSNETMNQNLANSSQSQENFAISRIVKCDKGHLVLYADCGQNAAVPSESVQVFSLVVSILDTTLPGLPFSAK